LQPAKGGVGFLIMKANVPVVPAYIEGNFSAFPKGAKLIKPSKIIVRYGKPILPEEFHGLGTDKEAYNKAAELVMARITELKNR